MNERDVDIAVSVPLAQDALRFVILLGVTSLFADMTYFLCLAPAANASSDIA
jgi:hypothetical protein